MSEKKSVNPNYGDYQVGKEVYFFDLNNLENGIHIGKIINVNYVYDSGDESYGTCGYIGPTHTWEITFTNENYANITFEISRTSLQGEYENYISYSYNKFIGLDTYNSVAKTYLRISTDKQVLVKGLIEEYGNNLNSIITRKNTLLNELSIIEGKEKFINNKLKYLNKFI